MAWHYQDKRFTRIEEVAAQLTAQGRLSVSHLVFNTESAYPGFELQQPLELSRKEVEAWLEAMTPGDVWTTPVGDVILH